MDHYRMYLYRDGHIQAGQAFSASNDIEATETAGFIYEACSDVADACELWRGAECVARMSAQPGDAMITPRDLVERYDAMANDQQQSIRDLEEDLRNSWSCIRESKKLLHTVLRLRDRSS
jgi:hypothetical protein